MADKARSAVLSRIRQSLGVTGEETDRRARVTDRLMRTPTGLIPERGQLPRDQRIDLFQDLAETYDATISRVAGCDDVPEAIADYLRQHNLPAEIRHGTDRVLTALPWDKTPHVEVSVGAATGKELTGLSNALGAVAESGTLILGSGPDNPTTLNFLSDHHIVLVAARDITGNYESQWHALRARAGRGQMPRVVNMITGPSRSADIGQTLILGAHGPRALHIIIVGDPDD